MRIKIPLRDAFKIATFFFKPRIKLGKLFIALEGILEVLANNPDLLRLNLKELSLDEEERILLILTSNNQIKIILIITNSKGKLKKTESLPQEDFPVCLQSPVCVPSLPGHQQRQAKATGRCRDGGELKEDILSFRSKLEEKYRAIRLSLLLDKKAQNNLVKEVNNSDEHPFISYLAGLQKELREERIVIYPSPSPLPLFLSLNAKEILSKFFPLLGIRKKPTLISLIKIPWWTIKILAKCPVLRLLIFLIQTDLIFPFCFGSI